MPNRLPSPDRPSRGRDDPHATHERAKNPPGRRAQRDIHAGGARIPAHPSTRTHHTHPLHAPRPSTTKTPGPTRPRSRPERRETEHVAAARCFATQLDRDPVDWLTPPGRKLNKERGGQKKGSNQSIIIIIFSVYQLKAKQTMHTGRHKHSLCRASMKAVIGASRGHLSNGGGRRLPHPSIAGAATLWHGPSNPVPQLRQDAPARLRITTHIPCVVPVGEAASSTCCS